MSHLAEISAKNRDKARITHLVTHRAPVGNIQGQKVALPRFLSEPLFISMYEMLLTGPTMRRREEISA